MPETAITERRIEAQEGSQYAFLSCSSDIAVFGGEAGCGKSGALLLEPLRHIYNPHFGAVVFRRTFAQIMKKGGLWDSSFEFYPLLGAKPRESTYDWTFPSNATIAFAHMQHESNKNDWDGSQIPLIEFDELTHFEWDMFWYMLSRNRSTCGVRPYVRASCNPDPDHWLRSFLSWYIDEESGLAIDERSGVERFFVRQRDDTIDWDDDPHALANRNSADRVKSFTFVKGHIEENKILLDKDPGYISNLENLPGVTYQRLRRGNWNARPQRGDYFKRSYFQIVQHPPKCTSIIRYWDRAATGEDKAKKKSSYTAGVKLGKTPDGEYVILHIERFRGTPTEVVSRIDNIATDDGLNVKIGIEEDPGQAGKVEAGIHVKRLTEKGHTVYKNKVRESKGRRAEPVSAAAGNNLIKIVAGQWVEDFLLEAEAYDGTDGCMADQIDALSGAFLGLTSKKEAFIG